MKAKIKTNFSCSRLTSNSGGLGRGMAATLEGGTARKPVHVNACEPCTIAGKEVTARKDGTNSMKAKTKRAARLPKGKVMWAHPDRMILCGKNYNGELTRYAVIPCPKSHEQARAWVRLAGMSDRDMIERVAKTLNQRASGPEFGPLFMPHDRETARAVLRALGLGQGGGR